MRGFDPLVPVHTARLLNIEARVCSVVPTASLGCVPCGQESVLTGCMAFLTFMAAFKDVLKQLAEP